MKVILRRIISWINIETANHLISFWKIRGKLLKMSNAAFRFLHPVLYSMVFFKPIDGITFISSIKILNLILPRIISSNVIYKWYQAELRLIWLYLFSTVSIFHGKIHLCIPSMMVRGIVQKQNVDYFQYNNLHSHHLHLLQFWTHKFLKYWRI